MASTMDRAWCLHCAGWTVTEINEALHISHARDIIASSWGLDLGRPSPEAMARSLASTMEQKDEKEKIG